jgi:hypothetical protein
LGYIVGFRKLMAPVRQKHFTSAKDALDFVATLTLDDGELEYILAPGGQHLLIEELRDAAREVDQDPPTQPES